jgi:hypothetical protein
MGGVQPWTVKAMSNLKPIYVTLKEGRHKTQPWTFTIDRPGPQKKETKAEWYATMYSAKRGALRVLQVEEKGIAPCSSYTIKGKVRPVKFIVVRLPKKKK